MASTTWGELNAAESGTVKMAARTPLTSVLLAVTMLPAYLIVAIPVGVKPRPVIATLLALPLVSSDRVTESSEVGVGAGVAVGTGVGGGRGVAVGAGARVDVGGGGGVGIGGRVVEAGIGVGIEVGFGVEVAAIVGAGSGVAVGRLTIAVCRRASTVASIFGVDLGVAVGSAGANVA
jgi:hypothetical protein